ncbi:MAG TPA: NF038129 family PEP-CTERM protein [Thiobacillus sp.]|nr:NF038129 family PEP-CTERM protein [Thiobacillus sp.]
MFKHKLFKPTLLLLALGISLAQSAHAGIWQVDIDTSSLAGIGGYLDLQLNPGGADAQPVQARIGSFSTDATLGAGVADGAASGSLAGVLVLDNTDALNAWLQGLVFGSHIAFTLDIDAVLDAGSGSSFATLLWDADFNPLLAAAGEDAALRIDLMPAAAPTWGMSSAVQVSAVPEPPITAILLAGLGLMGFVVKRRTSS